MKNLLRVGFLVVGVLWAFGATGNAQVSRRYIAHVPFDFNVGNKFMKAGDYTVGPVDGATNQRALILTSRADGDAIVIGQAAIGSSDLNKQGRFTFGKYGDEWVLQEVTTQQYELKLRRPRSTDQNVASNIKATEKRSIVIGN